jgi:SNF2 family DNA or RNA helicase
MQHKGNHGPFLVVSPMALLRNNWQYEFERWLPHCRTVVYDGDRDQRKVLRYAEVSPERQREKER